MENHSVRLLGLLEGKKMPGLPYPIQQALGTYGY